jgi:asparagine synthase (glutamine-hydrolysing)
MCGIAGILATAGEADKARADAAAMAACLEHRGPNDHGVDAGPGWAIAMQRLSVQDTSDAGHQPMRLRDLLLVFNGEVYNFPELRSELEGHGYRFASRSDTEVVLAALEHWGPAALARFNGMFALALVDRRRRTALLARDRFGKKPLFVGRERDRVLFASELKSLLRVARGELTLCHDALAEYFRFQYVPAPRSIFREVTKLPPASWVTVDLDTGAVSEPTTFWSLPAAGGPAASAEEVVETIRMAVRRRLIADVPVGAFLSGGTDSSLVVAGMRAAAADVRTFSIGFADPRFDESRYAKAVAAHLGTRHTHRQLEWREAMALVPSLATSYDEPFADSSALPTLAVSQLAREHVTVALSGDGGDELFGGYTRYRTSKLLRLAALTPRAVAAGLQRGRGDSRIARRARVFGALAAAPDEGGMYREAVSVWRSDELSRLIPIGTAAGSDRAAAWSAFPSANGSGPTERMMRCDARTYLVDDILQKVDRASMSVSLEARNPLLDPDVVAVAMRSLSHAERQPGAKPLLRDALRHDLPDELVDRPKMGFGVPVGEWMRDGLRPMVEDLVLSRTATEYDSTAARAVVDQHLSGQREAGHQVWTLLMFELWRDRWLRD